MTTSNQSGTPSLNFPKPLAKSDFFSIPPTTSPEAVSILDKYAPEEPVEQFEGQEDEPDYTNADPKVAGDVGDILAKYTDDADGDDDEEPKDAQKPVQKAADTVTEPVVTDPAQVLSTDPVNITSTDLGDVANMLSEKGLIVDIPEGFPMDDVNPENFWELISHNISKKAEESFGSGYESARQDIAAALSPEVMELVNYQMEFPNADLDDVRVHIENVLWKRDITALDPSDEVGAETIVRSWLKDTHSAAEIDAEIADLKTFGRLQQRAEMFKPKLEAKAQQEIQNRQKQQQAIVAAEQRGHEEFMDRVKGVLDKGVINGVPLGQEEKQKLWNIYKYNRVPVPVPGGKQVEMGYVNFLIAKNMYTPEGNIENLLLSTLILEGGTEVLKRFVTVPAVKEEVKKFRSSASAGTFSTTTKPAGNSAPAKKPDPKTFFSRSLV